MTKRFTWKMILFWLVVLVTFFLAYSVYAKRTIKLTLGLYAASSWDVPASDTKVIDRAIARFEEHHPNVKVTYETGIPKEDYSDWLAEKIVDGKEPDLFLLPNQDFNRLASTKALRDLSAYVDTDLDSKIFYSAAFRSGQYNNHQYALPFESNPVMLCINKDLLDKAHITIPKAGWSLDEFLTICKRLTVDENQDGHPEQYAITNYTWQDALAAYGASLASRDGSKLYLDSQPMKNALSVVSRLQALNGQDSVSPSDFDQGRVAFMPMTLAQYRTYKPYPYRVAKYTDFTWTCVPLPAKTKYTKASALQVSLFAIGAKTKHGSLAWDLLKELVSEQTQQDLMEKSQGTAVLPTVVLSKKTNQLLSNDALGADALTAPTLNQILHHSRPQPTFKNYQKLLEQADYLINQSLDRQNFDNDLTKIQKELVDGR